MIDLPLVLRGQTQCLCDALGGMGVGGAAGPYAVSAANAILYALFSVVCIIAGVVNNRIGLNYGLAIGSIGYPLYGAGLYTNNYKTNTWLLLFVPTACSISAGFFYAAEAAIVIGYPSHSKRAFYLTIWATAEAVRPIISSAINLGTNVKRNFIGQVSNMTYIIFMVICLGLLIALCLSLASKAKEFKMIFELFLMRRILMFLPAFFISYFFIAFQGTWWTMYFTVRARALLSFLLYFSNNFVAFLLTAILDCQSLPLKIQARVGFLIVIFIMIGTWLWAIILQKRFYDAETRPILDWGDEDYPATFLLSFFWCTQSQKTVNHFTSIGLNLGITVICIVPAWIIISELEHSYDIQVTDAELNGMEMKTEQLKEREAGKN
ncbi:hypothetical protein FANTH_14299 [Fusarium anthophilum]|uniref:Uncharacterized protein n=1 Tax=Fusarium anthophilum TaxID=48485 RepID=A0A8H4YJ59_9HYPO|nr:hypothetical protein FANTH_14299 [Fusarium anthophilum]